MLIWYAATAAVAVWAIFDSPALDYRLVMVGAVVPVAEVVLGRPGPLHSMLSAVAVLALVMITTTGARLRRRRWLGIPIGLMSYLVFSGIWTDTDAFWWPATGLSLSNGPAPEASQIPLRLVLEVVGVGLAWWWWRRVGLVEPTARQRFLSSGQIPRVHQTPRGGC